MGYVEYELVEEPDEGVTETGSIDSRDNVLEVLANAFEEKYGERWEYGV
jgi:hypothetical protein